MRVRGRRFVSFWKEHGSAVALRLLRVKLGNAIAGRPVFNNIDAGGVESSAKEASVRELHAARFTMLTPLPTYLIPAARLRRISLVTDSIGSGSLFGGVGTALLLAAQLANRMDATLRIVTRTEEAVPTNAAEVLRVYGVELRHELQFAFAPVLTGRHAEAESPVAAPGLDMLPDELFITSSWWTTFAALPSVPRESIIYLLQEDERMFYPFGEDRLHCDEVLQNRDIRFIINTRLLHEHLISSGLTHLATQAQWFEPSFPTSLFHPRSREGGKRRFFYYARPHNSRNLFHVGLTAIERAINEGVLDLDQWEIFLVGKNIPAVTFADGHQPTRCEGLSWQAYADLVGTIDLGLSLMYTPHPSYPPLDLAASGAVVVTNKFGNKQELSRYSNNIICSELKADALVEALRQGVALAEDEEARRRNHLDNGLGVDWAESFKGVLQSLTTER